LFSSDVVAFKNLNNQRKNILSAANQYLHIVFFFLSFNDQKLFFLAIFENQSKQMLNHLKMFSLKAVAFNT